MKPWPEVDFLDAFDDVTGGHLKTKQGDYKASGRYPIVDQGKALVGGYTDDTSAVARVELPVVIFGDHTKCVKYVDFEFGLGADGVKILRPRDGVDPRYAYHTIRTIQVPDGGYSRHFKFLKESRIPLPPIHEQRRIAAVLDAADALRTKRHRALAKVDALTAAIFVHMFGGPDRFTVGKLGVHVPTTSGGTPSRSKHEYFGGDIPWVKSGELAHGTVVDTEERITAEAVANSSAKLMPPGTVLVAMYGATVGAVATLGIQATTNQAICCLSPTSEITGPYLASYLRLVKPELLRRAAGGAQPNISQAIIRDLDLPLAPVDLQRTYVERVAAVASMKDATLASTKRLDTLFASLQQRAFRGQL